MPLAALNYAQKYERALADAFPNTLHFGALYSTANNQLYRFTGAKSIQIPSMTTTGRVDGDRDTIGIAERNYTNSYEEKTLTRIRKWKTLVHPDDIDSTNEVATIQNITTSYNQNKKFPEMDRYLVSKIYADWAAQGGVPVTTALTEANALRTLDDMMSRMDDANVPQTGRVLYITPPVFSLFKRASEMTRAINVKDAGTRVVREISRIDEVELVRVPSNIMKTEFDFSVGSEPIESADSINMFLVHPSAVITPVKYNFAQLDPPAAGSDGKYIYYEESIEDVFILNKRADAIGFATTPYSAQ
jgi:hypothetical protein